MSFCRRIRRLVFWMKLLAVTQGRAPLQSIAAARSLVSGSPVITVIEIGVFKGDTAVGLARVIKASGAAIRYYGLDLFEDKDAFFAAHTEDRAQYDTADYPYWEFTSGEHTYARVREKVHTVMSAQECTLIRGDSTKTLPDLAARLGLRPDLVYIDGCHDRDVVEMDWGNVGNLARVGTDLVVVFDDYLSDGVAAVVDVISSDSRWRLYWLNANQVAVVSVRAPLVSRVTIWSTAFAVRSLSSRPALRATVQSTISILRTLRRVFRRSS